MAEPQTLSPLHLALGALPTRSPLLLEGCEAKESSEREGLPAQACQEHFTQTFSQKLEILCGHAVSGLRLYPSPQPQENSCCPGMLNQRALILPLLQQKWVLSLPCCIATDSLYIKGGCVSLFSSFLFHAGEKHWPDCPGLYLPSCWSDETSPSPCLASAPAPGRTGSSSRAGGAV